MFSKKTVGILLIVVGIGLLAASLLADVIGLGDAIVFGPHQTMGAVAGAVIAAVGLILTLKAK